MKKMMHVLLGAAMMTFLLSGQVMAMNTAENEKWTTFQGVVKKMPVGLHGTWIIGGRTVRVTPYSKVEQNHGLGTLGSYAKVWGIARGKAFHAQIVQIRPGGQFLTIEPSDHKHEDGHFEGIIQKIPKEDIGFWEIDGHRVLVDKLSRVIKAHGQAVSGALAFVAGYYRNNTFYAQQLVVK